jgi:probable HAF family extracellular repeat protein
VPIDLGTLAGSTSEATALNDGGQVVGWSLAADGRRHPFVWAEGTMVDLGLSAGQDEGVARAINNRGWVVGYEQEGSGYRPVRWAVPSNGAPAARFDASVGIVGAFGGPIAYRNEGQSFLYSAAPSSDPDGDPLTFRWIWNDGTPDGAGVTAAHTYADNGRIPVVLLVTDEHGAVGGNGFYVGIYNVVPSIGMVVIDLTVLNRPRAGTAWPVGFRWTDPGVRDAPWQWTIAWGDGTSSSGTKPDRSQIDASHTYALPGSYTARLTITDKDGGTSAPRAVVVEVQP